jgi:hypothetical protein
VDVQCGDLGELVVRPLDHGAELQHSKDLPSSSSSTLLEEHRTPRVDFDRKREQKEEWAQDDEQHTRGASLGYMPGASAASPFDGRIRTVDLCDREQG